MHRPLIVQKKIINAKLRVDYGKIGNYYTCIGKLSNSNNGWMDLIMLKDQFNFVNDNSWEKKKSANC